MNDHPQGSCPDPKPYRIVGDVLRARYYLCDPCVARLSGPPLSYVFVPIDPPKPAPPVKPRRPWYVVIEPPYIGRHR